MRIKRNIQFIVASLLCVLVIGIAWAETSGDIYVDHKDVKATFIGRVAYEDNVLFPDYVTYYGNIGGSERDKITSANAGTIKISPEGVASWTETAYYGHPIENKQKKFSYKANFVDVTYSFSSVKKSFRLTSI